MKIQNREHWLAECATRLEPVLAEAGSPVTDPYRVTCGWPAVGALARAKRRIGECWQKTVSADGTVEIFISPVVSDPVEVAAVLAHELVHAAGHHDHKAKFAKACFAIGLEGKPTATVPGEAFKQRIAPVLEKLGPYPHGTMNPSVQRKKQTTRLLKVLCPTPDYHDGGEEYIVRMSQKTLDLAPPICGICTSGMVLDGDGPEEEDAPPVTVKARKVKAKADDLPILDPPAPVLVDFHWLDGFGTEWGIMTPVKAKPRKRPAPVPANANETVTEDDVVDPATLFVPDVQEGEEVHQCAGGDGNRLCRKYNGKWICTGCWRKRVALAGKAR